MAVAAKLLSIKSVQRQHTLRHKTVVRLMRIKMYFVIGRMLHLIFIFGLLLFFIAGNLALQAFEQNNYVLMALYGYLCAYGFSLLFFSQLDAKSRYQNYKFVKDKIYEYGLQQRIIRPFMYSRCQREAILIAAKSFGKGKECTKIFREMGFKWFHIIPRMLLKNPKFLFSKKYWSITLFASHYESKYFSW